MSQYYTSKRTKNIFSPNSKEPFKLSRSKIDLFLECERCFYLDRRLGIGRPPGFPFNLNTAVDTLLKKEFDMHRVDQATHPLMKQYGINAVPFMHEMMDEWRENFKGVQYHHKKSGFVVTGAVDDIWVNQKGELIVVDYKSTAKEQGVGIDAPWQIAYKRQMEVYQWLLRKNDFKVNKTGYFVYCNGRTDRTAFDGRLEFDVEIIPYKGDTKWIEKALLDARNCLLSDGVPLANEKCDYCAYRKAAGEELQKIAGVQTRLL
jgi:CRISPR/Cas system-associated exonuclease Cas4 (RecB family)